MEFVAEAGRPLWPRLKDAGNIYTERMMDRSTFTLIDMGISRGHHQSIQLPRRGGAMDANEVSSQHQH